jgi:hypothetical protein
MPGRQNTFSSIASLSKQGNLLALTEMTLWQMARNGNVRLKTQSFVNILPTKNRPYIPFAISPQMVSTVNRAISDANIEAPAPTKRKFEAGKEDEFENYIKNVHIST